MEGWASNAWGGEVGTGVACKGAEDPGGVEESTPWAIRADREASHSGRS